MTRFRCGATRRDMIGALATIPTLGLSSSCEAQAEPRTQAGGVTASADTWKRLPPTPVLPTPLRSDHVTVNGTSVFYAQFGTADGPAVLLLHGGLGNSNYWGHQVTHLATRFSVVVMDTRGHGRSPVVAREFGYGLFARDAVALLDSLAINRVAVVGWSDGAVTGLELAMVHRERVSRLFAFGGNSAPDGMIPNGARKPTFAEYGRRCRGEYATLSPHPERWPLLVGGLRTMWGREPNFSRAQLATIEVPTTIADGVHDEIIRAEHTQRLADAIRESSLVTMPGVSHFAMLQAPERFNAALDAFLG